MESDESRALETISSTAGDHLKVIWAALEWGGAPTTVKALAERFGTSPAAASSTIKRLVGQGLLLHQPYGPILLTPAGERLAVMMVRRHRLIETFLVKHLGYSWDEVHDEAETLEHASSDLLIDRIDDLLDNPRIDPHGDPIPTRTGEVFYPAGATRVSAAKPGNYVVTRISDDSAALLGWFDSSGISTGSTLSVAGTDESGTHVTVDGKELLLSKAAGAAIVVVSD